MTDQAIFDKVVRTAEEQAEHDRRNEENAVIMTQQLVDMLRERGMSEEEIEEYLKDG